MIHIETDNTGRVTCVNYRGQGDGGYMVESIPSPEEKEGKIPVMYYRDGRIVYDYVERPLPQEPDELTEPQLDYNEVVDGLVRQKYSLSEELAILRQRDSKPDEFEAYNTYAEECKAKAREMMGKEGAE